MFKIKKGDQVKVISGKDRGKSGQVLFVLREKNRVVVQGINIIKKHQKATAQGEKSRIVEKEAPIHISNVMLVGEGGKTVRVGFKVEKDKKVRINKKTNKVLNSK